MIYSSKKYNANLIAFLASRVLNKTSKNLLFHNLYSLLTSHRELIVHNSKTSYYQENCLETLQKASLVNTIDKDTKSFQIFLIEVSLSYLCYLYRKTTQLRGDIVYSNLYDTFSIFSHSGVDSLHCLRWTDFRKKLSEKNEQNYEQL